jgi:hypothetical protein
MRGRQAHRARIRASRAVKCMQVSGASNARIFFAIDARGAAPRRLQRARAPGTAGSRHTWPRGSQGSHTGEPGSKVRTILRGVQRAYFRRNRRTGSGARSITVHSRRCLSWPRCFRHQAHRARTRRRRRSDTAKRSGFVSGIHPCFFFQRFQRFCD